MTDPASIFARQRDPLVGRLIAAFPAEPVPPYPPGFGLDPLGERDEYAGFADRPWTDVAPEHLAWNVYDISPAIGFAQQSPPHLWNYYTPAFLRGALLHEAEHDIVDGFLWRLREQLPRIGPSDPTLPWWHGATAFANYSAVQCDAVIACLELVRDCGEAAPLWFDWEPADDLVLHAWGARRAMLAAGG